MTISLTFTDVNQAFEDLTGTFRAAEITNLPDSRIIQETSRNGDVLTFSEPVSLTFTEPWNRVLFNSARDCNPFFHLFEAIWMLSGSNRLTEVEHFNSGMKNYSDDGKTLNGAYGYRWRKHYDYTVNEIGGFGLESGTDQLEILINHLDLHPDSRRAVLQMWNVEDDLLKIDNQFDQYSKDVCCNTAAYFRITNEDGIDKLHMTVTNRSNDLIWGTLGANYVHFSFLQEYMAGRLGVVMGTYTQFTNNLHTYLDKFEGEKYLDYYNSKDHKQYVEYLKSAEPLLLISMFDGVETKDDQLLIDKLMVDLVDSITMNPKHWFDYSMNADFHEFPFIGDVVIPAIGAFQSHKLRQYDKALKYCMGVEHPHWRWACREWIVKRKENWENKNQRVNLEDQPMTDPR